MKLSETADYKTAIFASMNGELETAREAYQRLLDEAESNDDEIAISFLMQSLANVEARDGNVELGHELHLRAIGQSPGVPLNLIAYAKGLARHFSDPELAEKKLQEAELMLQSDKWNRRADNISPESYTEQIALVRDELKESSQ